MCTQAKANNFKAGESLSTLDPHVLPLSKGGIRIYDAVSDVVESGVQWSVIQKNTDFHQFLCHPGKIIRRLAAVTILRPPTFHIAHLKRYVHKFSGVPPKSTCCERFGLQLLSNSEEFIFVTPERPF